MKYEITKGSEKDFEGAPEWAAHVVKLNRDSSVAWVSGRDNKYQYKYDPDEQYGHPIQGSFISWDWRDGVEIIAERRPITEQAWDGEGLPPVGALCRCRGFSDMPWVECEVLAWHDDEVWLKRVDDGKTFTMGNPELFPIPSPEDVARDEAIEAMRDVGYTLPAAIRFTKEEMAALYDAGYRKME
ncbi:hypothetical protein ACP3TB_21500 (plasmid) [Rahnella variigena]|uniref:hypothetical protein n=1 Tax=Rahnella variigena TaxID=574964 RepID=UPI003CE7E816